MLLSPTAVWELAGRINVDGWYEVVGTTPRGGVLWTFWGIEAVIIVLGSTTLAGLVTDAPVFCEPCEQWCRRKENALQLKVVRKVPDDNGKMDTQIEDVTEIWCVAPDDLERLNAPRQRTTAPEEAPRRPASMPSYNS